MKTLRICSVALAVLAAAVLAFGAVGFDTTSAERDVAVSVVDDDRAYVGYESQSKVIALLGGATERELVTIENRLPAAITDVEATAETDGFDAIASVDLHEPETIAPGDHATVDGTFEGLGVFELHVSLQVESDDAQVELDGDTAERSMTVITFNPVFRGSDAEIKGPSQGHLHQADHASTTVDHSFDAIVWYEDNGSLDRTRASLDPDVSVQEQLSTGDTTHDIVALAFPGFETTHVNPQAAFSDGQSIRTTIGNDGCLDGVATTEADFEYLEPCSR